MMGWLIAGVLIVIIVALLWGINDTMKSWD